MLTAPFYQYWGKCHQGDQTDRYHLLAYHNLDVAACEYQLVKHNYFNSTELFEQIGFQTDENEKAASWFTYFLSWHDIGKFANAFHKRKIRLNNELWLTITPEKANTNPKACEYMQALLYHVCTWDMVILLLIVELLSLYSLSACMLHL